MRKFMDDPDDLVADALRGLAAAHPELRVDHAAGIVYRAEPARPGTVGVISGGGSGHEPLHAGFVGLGMLDAAVVGPLFTSPTPDRILEATTNVDSGAGVLHIVKNYTGDVMNFDMAAEFAAASGTDVRAVVVDDDVAVEDSLHTAGRRGTGLTVILEKIVGAAADEGRSLDDLVALAQRIVAHGRSMGAALSSCSVPGHGEPALIPEGEMEFGVGIHGEPGRSRLPFRGARDLAARLVDSVVHELETSDDPAIVMLSGLGGTPLIELHVVYGHVARELESRGIAVARSLVGDYVTSLDMIGCALTVLRADDDMIGLWDAPVRTPALRWKA
ncbi:dihydroxyacetone kinase subunit DhaK [Agromyces atrinae]|uniref:dihydroxyacetone kinase subunit DhaK n=1 Tax=Agromyces atrinae TaxID=592376 RepID=UPI001F5770B4|nr:dihydroxyacetone kinase subunit DhaK [Agromyces atrinae]MCI2957888.1 dihydroxyacetone kinase subunit DhaK [Agromyces atrinae]